ncbi:MAG: Holliday junction branch migration protein RuvA [Mycoplasmataceae bacterium]|jgi:Holliday junction DNA helicase RuvA|nr:Holliday junction branch migration protein RuvA [Mycoplasmataceae bacterium]
MYSYLVGKIISSNKKSITFENNYTGYHIYVSDPSMFEIGKVCKIYVIKNLSINNNKNRIVEELYGFGKYDQKELFLKLINVGGIGYRTALNICYNDVNQLKSLILAKDSDTLSSLPGITPKIARAIVDEVYIDTDDTTSNNKSAMVSDLVKALKSLGYEKKEIDLALHNVKVTEGLELSDLISSAIKLIVSEGEDVNKSTSI